MILATYMYKVNYETYNGLGRSEVIGIIKPESATIWSRLRLVNDIVKYLETNTDFNSLVSKQSSEL